MLSGGLEPHPLAASESVSASDAAEAGAAALDFDMEDLAKLLAKTEPGQSEAASPAARRLHRILKARFSQPATAVSASAASAAAASLGSPVMRTIVPPGLTTLTSDFWSPLCANKASQNRRVEFPWSGLQRGFQHVVEVFQLVFVLLLAQSNGT